MNDNRMIRIMVFEPGRAPYTTMLEDSLEHRQELVGGDIECIPLPCETVLCCNASGKLTGLPENRQYGPDILHGTFFLYCDMITASINWGAALCWTTLGCLTAINSWRWIIVRF